MVFVNNSLVFQCPSPVILSGSEARQVGFYWGAGRGYGSFACGPSNRARRSQRRRGALMRKPTPGVAPACPALAEPEFVARPLGLRAEASCPRPPPRICVKCPTYGRASRSLRRAEARTLCLAPAGYGPRKNRETNSNAFGVPPPKFFCRENRKISFLPRFYTVSSVSVAPGTSRP